jgi:hypothetical protein
LSVVVKGNNHWINTYHRLWSTPASLNRHPLILPLELQLPGHIEEVQLKTARVCRFQIGIYNQNQGSHLGLGKSRLTPKITVRLNWKSNDNIFYLAVSNQVEYPCTRTMIEQEGRYANGRAYTARVTSLINLIYFIPVLCFYKGIGRSRANQIIICKGFVSILPINHL